jgi:hypothetical protein
MKKIVLFCALMAFKFGLSQGIIAVKVVSYKKSGYDNLKWLAYTNENDSIFCKNKPKIGKVLHYKDTLYNYIYNVSEYETDIFKTALKNTRIAETCAKEIITIKSIRNKKGSQFKWTIMTDQNISYQSNVKLAKGRVVFFLNDKNEVLLINIATDFSD